MDFVGSERFEANKRKQTKKCFPIIEREMFEKKSLKTLLALAGVRRGVFGWLLVYFVPASLITGGLKIS